MSDRFLVVIPSNPKADLPAAADELRAALSEIAGASETRVKDYGKLQFIDCGEDFQSASCPHCNAEIAMETWHTWMEEDWHGEEGFHLHRHKTSCCGQDINLNEIIYDLPQGFARWMASARNTGRGPLTEAELKRLEAVARLPLRALAQTY